MSSKDIPLSRWSISVGGQRFSSKDALRDHIRSLIERYGNNVAFDPPDFDFFYDLLGHHPNVQQKMGVGVASIYLIRNPVYPKTRTLMLKRTDGSTTDWSWRECLNPSPHDKKVRAAMRALIEPTTMALKQHFFASHAPPVHCPITGIAMDLSNAHVDHTPPLTFERLLQDFLREERITMGDIALSPSADHTYQDVLLDDSLSIRWRQYHDTHAVLRVISAHANMSIVPRLLRESTEGADNDQ